mmetsp:Transcript_8153/g.13047  ORF Transcript_8153/g.13047 Transcript_8153/m.13047 type:complete len:113 (-) Transcript_8153:145-483(-)
MQRFLKLLFFLLLTQVVYGRSEEEEEESETLDPDELTDEDPDEIMKDFDKDGDGMLSLKEITEDAENEASEEELAVVKKAFEKSDKDGNGLVSKDELLGMLEELKKDTGEEL